MCESRRFIISRRSPRDMDPDRLTAVSDMVQLFETFDNKDADGTMIPETEKRTADHNHSSAPHLDEDGLIIPRKPANPVKENPERQNLHKELAFYQKIGKNVLNQKSELQRALEKQKDNLAKKELENNIQARQPELEKVIAERAKKLEGKTNDSQNEDDKVLNSDFLQARMKLKTRTDSK
ncbi:hypothetical protein WA026_007204 [Henosepilachna vigintioctopunctata]|uniref:Protein FAM107B n=2 Tax=Henosepilachna vigintioctopunctata TaxID=420089 RepID=A0AAW1V9N8_9CUCU